MASLHRRGWLLNGELPAGRAFVTADKPVATTANAAVRMPVVAPAANSPCCGQKRRVKAIHAEISNRRKDFLHKLSSRLVAEHGCIVVGDVNSQALVRGLHA